jgi:hypothetical protein
MPADKVVEHFLAYVAVTLGGLKGGCRTHFFQSQERNQSLNALKQESVRNDCAVKVAIELFSTYSDARLVSFPDLARSPL